MTAEATGEDIPEIFETTVNQNAGYNFTLSVELAEFHGLVNAESVSYTPFVKNVGEPKPSKLAYRVTSDEGAGGIRRSIVTHSSNKVTVRLPAAIAESHGYDITGADEVDKTIYVETVDKGVFNLIPVAQPELEGLNPVEDTATLSGFSKNVRGPPRNTGYRLYVPSQFHSLYELEGSGSARWDLRVYKDELALLITPRKEVEPESHRGVTAANLNRWHTERSGYGDADSPTSVTQVQMLAPKGLVKLLGWGNTGLAIEPHEDRMIVIALAD